MADIAEAGESQATILCKACGLCCTGHLFAWVKLKSAELDSAEAMGMHVYGSHPAERGFSQPCPLWKGECTIYESPHYPRACRAYRCKLLKELDGENTELSIALVVVKKAKEMIAEVEALLPASESKNFRERLVAYIEHPQIPAGQDEVYQAFRSKADELLLYYERYFGVTDLFQ